MPKLATWLRKKDEPYFNPFFAKHLSMEIHNGLTNNGSLEDMDGLLLTGGSDIAPEFLRQKIPDPSVLEPDVDPARDQWEFAAIETAMERGLPILAICKGMQILNVALGGTLQLDIPGHRLPEQKNNDIQPLRTDSNAAHRFENVNSSHHQAVERVAPGFKVEAWSSDDGIIEQMRMNNRPFVLAVQYHPERGKIYDGLFDDFFDRLKNS